MKYKFKFTVIIPIYNTEKYVEDTILSVINQTIGFEENIQIILVNDGSTDNSEEICKKYESKYPENIKYIKQENAGVSSARNNGFKHAEGRYINFLDADDIWQEGVFKVALEMFESNPGLPLIGVRQKFFEATDRFSPLNYKFKQGNRIVDVTKEFDQIQLSVTSAFFDVQYLEDTLFDTKIKYSEDAKYIYEILIKNKKNEYGLIANPYYLYRKRLTKNSAIQTKDLSADWYFVTTELSYKYLLDLAYKEKADFVNTIGYYIIYDYQWRMKADIDKFLDKEEKEKYLQITRELLERIPDECITQQKQIGHIEKNILLNFKYNNDYKKVNKVLFENLDKLIYIDIFEASNNELIIEGYAPYLKANKIDFYVKTNKKLQKLNMVKRKYPYKKNCLGINSTLGGFKLRLELEDIDTLEFMVKIEKQKEKLELRLGNLTKLWNRKAAYYRYKNNIIYIKNKDTVIVKHNQNWLKCVIKELKFLLRFKKIKPLIIRVLHDIFTKSKKQIWIFSERQSIAGDNAEALFKYVNQQQNRNIKSYFVIEKGSKDVPRLKEYGKVIYYRTLKYMLLFLKSTYIISSHSEPYTTNCFGKNLKWFKDLFKFKYVFLQHGIIRNDLSDWLHKYNKNIAMFITTTELEQEAIAHDYDYFYDKKVVKLTGLPRYDTLYENDLKLKKQILILPTWRSYLAGPRINRSQKRKYSETFKESNFFKNYNSLINDERIIEALKKYGYKIKFCLHPSLVEQTKDFENKNSEYVEICKKNLNYQKEFKSSKVLITDYSSVSCDFAYLKKLVIYLKLDKEEFFSGHICEEGFFDEEKDGFGPVCYDYKSSVNTIIDLMKKDFELTKEYEEHIDRFFKFRDDRNCERVYKELLKLSNE